MDSRYNLEMDRELEILKIVNHPFVIKYIDDF
jgi:hypothetical protein